MKSNNKIKILRKGALLLVKMYQKTLSPAHGLLSYKHPYGYCKHYPTCSEYTYQAIDIYGVTKGGKMAIKRIFKCNPYSRGGYDPIDLTK